MSESKHTTGVVSQMPWHNGDGYCWGGDIVVSFGDRAINLGSATLSVQHEEILKLARLIAAAPELLAAAAYLASWDHCWPGNINLETAASMARAAIAKAEGR